MLGTEIEEASISNWCESIKNNRGKKKLGETVFSDHVVSNGHFIDTSCRTDNRLNPRTNSMNPCTTLPHEYLYFSEFFKICVIKKALMENYTENHLTIPIEAVWVMFSCIFHNCRTACECHT